MQSVGGALAAEPKLLNKDGESHLILKAIRHLNKLNRTPWNDYHYFRAITNVWCGCRQLTTVDSMSEY